MKKNLIHLSTYKGLFCALLLTISAIAVAENTHKNFVKGSFAAIQEQHKGQPYIIAFWSETCGYCMKELALLGRLLKQHPNVALVNITTDPFLDAETVESILEPRGVADTETWVFAENYPERLYYEVDKRWRGELPLTYFVDRDNKMTKHMGVVTEAQLIKWLNAQKKPLS